MGKKSLKTGDVPSRDELINVKSDLLLLAPEDSRPPKPILLRPPSIPGHGHSKIKVLIDPEDPPLGYTGRERDFASITKKTFVGVGKLTSLLILLYLFVCTLKLLSSSFRLLGGKSASSVFQESAVLTNPIVGLMIGVIVTVVVQSSSTSSSIIVSMVASELLDVRTAIPIIMGANVGTSVTNTIVSLGQVHDRDQFELAFSGATIHDMFNWLCVLVLLPLESATGYLYVFSKAALSGLSNVTHSDHLAAYIPLGDVGVGAILLIVSLICLCGCLISIVKILSSVLKGSVAVVVQRVLNADIPYCSWFTGYIAILVGAVMTFLLQSSSIFTSSLTPLVGLGMISIERVYPLTLGSNLGTTSTAILAAFSQEGNRLKYALQIALVHLFFNLTGIIMFYPFPFTRLPIPFAKKVGKITAKYRWFSIFYILMCFLVLPVLVFLLSLSGPVVMYSVFASVATLMLFITLINILQNRYHNYLPSVLRSWHFLPLPLRSLKPADDLLSMLMCCSKKPTAYTQVASTSSLKKLHTTKDDRVLSDPYLCAVNKSAELASIHIYRETCTSWK